MVVPDIALTAAIVAVAGLLHGYTGGFGSGLLMIPLLSIQIGPVQAIATSCIMGMAATIPLVRAARRSVSWRQLWPLVGAAIVTTPIAASFLFVADPTFIRRLIGAFVILSVALLATGWTYRGARTRLLDGLAGAVGGALSGIAGMSGPVVAIYFLSAPEPPETIRARIVFTVVALIIITFSTLMLAGVVEKATLIQAALVLPLNLGGVFLGAWLFRRAPAAWFRPAALVLLAVVGLSALVS